jgi:hypothetical protein
VLQPLIRLQRCRAHALQPGVARLRGSPRVLAQVVRAAHSPLRRGLLAVEADPRALASLRKRSVRIRRAAGVDVLMVLASLLPSKCELGAFETDAGGSLGCVQLSASLGSPRTACGATISAVSARVTAIAIQLRARATHARQHDGFNVWLSRPGTAPSGAPGSTTSSWRHGIKRREAKRVQPDPSRSATCSGPGRFGDTTRVRATRWRPR